MDQVTIVPPDELLPQGELFGELDFFAGGDSQPAQNYARHTGSTTYRRDEIVRSVLHYHLRGFGLREVARAHHISVNSVTALVRRARADGKLESERQRLARDLDGILEEQLEVYHTALREDRIPAREIPIHFGIFVDKRIMLEGCGAEAVPVGPNGGGLTPEQLNALISSLPRVLSLPGAAGLGPGGEVDSEGESHAGGPKPQQIL